VAAKKKASNGHATVTADMVLLLRQLVQGVNVTNARLEDLRGEVSELRGEVGELRGQVGAIREEVAGLRADMRSYQRQTDAQITDLAHEGADTGTAVVELRRTVATHGERLDKLEAMLKTGS
jgi:chromosome segregation ATPase